MAPCLPCSASSTAAPLPFATLPLMPETVCTARVRTDAWVSVRAAALAAGIGLLAAGTATAAGSEASTAFAGAAQAVTFTKGIAPLLRARCGACHRPGAVAPFSVLTYAEVRPWARAIRHATRTRSMPPWKPAPGYGGPFVGEQRLSDAEIALIAAWVDAGAPEGKRSDLAPAPADFSGWRLGEPDLVIEMPKPYRLQGRGDRRPAQVRDPDPDSGPAVRAGRGVPAGESEGRPPRQHEDRPDPGVPAARRGGSGARLRRGHPVRGAVPLRLFPGLDARTGAAAGGRGHGLDPRSRLGPAAGDAPDAERGAGGRAVAHRVLLHRRASDEGPVHDPSRQAGPGHSARGRRLPERGPLRPAGRRRRLRRATACALSGHPGAGVRDAAGPHAPAADRHRRLGLPLAGVVSLRRAGVPPAGYRARDGVRLRQFHRQPEQPPRAPAAGHLGTALRERDGRPLDSGGPASRCRPRPARPRPASDRARRGHRRLRDGARRRSRPADGPRRPSRSCIHSSEESRRR